MKAKNRIYDDPPGEIKPDDPPPVVIPPKP